MNRPCLAVLAATVFTGITSTAAMAMDPFSVRALDLPAGQIQTDEIIGPFYEALNAKSGGKVTPTHRSMTEISIPESDLLRVVADGTFDIGIIGAGGSQGVDAFLAMPDLAALAPNYEILLDVMSAAREPLAQRLKERHNVHMLSLFALVGQIFYCKGDDINSVADLSGKKVRVYNKPLADIVSALGATAVTIPLAEVYTSLQRGVADCAITGAMSGNTLGFPEVTDRLIPLVLGWAVDMHVANLDFWNGLAPDQQAFLTDQFGELETELRELANGLTQEGINCNIGKLPCERGKLHSMELVPVSPDDVRRVQEIARTILVPEWATACESVSPGCIEKWNTSVGKATDIIISR